MLAITTSEHSHGSGRTFPRVAAACGSISGVQLVRQGAYRLRAPQRVSLASAESQRLKRASHVHHRLSEVGYWEHNFATLLHSTVAALNLAQRIGASQELQMANESMGFVFGLAGLPSWFRYYTAQSRRVGESVDHDDTTAFSALLETIYFNCNARWEDLEAAGSRGEAMFEVLGDRFRWQTCVVLRAFGWLHRGDLTKAEGLFERAYGMVGSEGAVQAQVWCVAGLVSIDLARKGETSLERIVDLELLIERGLDHSDAIMAHGLLARAWFARDRERALRHARRTADLGAASPPGLLSHAAGQCPGHRALSRPLEIGGAARVAGTSAALSARARQVRV